MLRTKISIALCTFALSIATAYADDETSQVGARPLAPTSRAVAAGTGFPSTVWLQYTSGVTEGFDAGVRGDVYSSSPLGPMELGPGAGVGLPVRFTLGERAPWSFALRLTPDVAVGHMVGENCHTQGQGQLVCDEGNGLAVGMDVAFLADVATTGPRVITGLGFPMHAAKVAGRPGIDFVLPATIVGGLEVPVADGIDAFGLAQPGVALQATSDGTQTDGFLRLWLGVEAALP